ncbi:MAG: long-chain fatty acid--CoA ligase [Pseudomonadota bacterium]
MGSKTLQGDNVTSSPLLARFEETCSHNKDEVAFDCLGLRLTFDEVESLSSKIGGYLRDIPGLKPGDRIALQLPNISHYPILAWGALRAGLTIVNTNPMYTARELAHQLRDSGARVIVTMPNSLDVLADIATTTHIEYALVASPTGKSPAGLPSSLSGVSVSSLDEVLLNEMQYPRPNIPVTPHDLAVLQYTGGTTGVAKGCMLSHSNLFSSYLQLTESIPPKAGQQSVMIAPMPLYHVYGFQTNVVSFFLNGGASVLIPDPRNLDSLIDAMRSHPFTHLAGVNTLLNGLLRHPAFDTIDFSHLEYAFAGGTALALSVADEWEARTGVPVYEGYSMSETSSAICVNTKSERELGTVGKPHYDTEIRLANSQPADDSGQPRGELLVRGPQVMQGYWQQPNATTDAIDRDGWLRTGDIAVIQENGFVRIVDRVKDTVLVSGFNVYPNEIDAVVSSHPDVIDCATVGVPDAKTGEAVKVFVTTRNDQLTEATIREYCRTQLAAYKVPKAVVFLSELPKSPAGKILRRELRMRADEAEVSK